MAMGRPADEPRSGADVSLPDGQLPLLLTKRQAAKLLGIGRGTLGELIELGHIRTVDMLGHPPRISLEEAQRFAREGTGPVQPKPSRTRRALTGRAKLAAATRAIVIK